MHWQFGEMEFGEMKRNTSNWSNFGRLSRRAGLSAIAGLSCLVWFCFYQILILQDSSEIIVIANNYFYRT